MEFMLGMTAGIGLSMVAVGLGLIIGCIIAKKKGFKK